MDTKELVGLYLKKKYPNTEFSDLDLDFLAKYSIEKQKSENEILSDIGAKYCKIGDYYAAHKYVEEAKKNFQYIFGRFDAKKGVNAFDGNFKDFLAWWYSEMSDDGARHCCYCGIDEDTLSKAFNKDGGLIHSKKPAFSGELQIERMDPNGEYCHENCKFACVICNNAKSDMISAEDFKRFFVPGIQEYWEQVKEKLK